MASTKKPMSKKASKRLRKSKRLEKTRPLLVVQLSGSGGDRPIES